VEGEVGEGADVAGGEEGDEKDAELLALQRRGKPWFDAILAGAKGKPSWYLKYNLSLYML